VAVICNPFFTLTLSMTSFGPVPVINGAMTRSSRRGAGNPSTLRMEMGYTLLKNKMPSLTPALIWPVFPSPACSEACLIDFCHGVCFRPRSAIVLQSGVRHGSLDLVLAFPTMIRIAVAEDLQYLVWPCSGRRTACCQVERGSILFYLFLSILVVGIDGKDGDRSSQATLKVEDGKTLTSQVLGLAECAFRNCNSRY
jgi:hypothetical protein